MKKTIFLSMILLILIAVSLTISAKTVTSGSCGDNVFYTLDSNGRLEIYGNGKMREYRMERMAPPYPWEEYKEDIKCVIIKEGVKNIGAEAFYDHRNLTKVTVSNGVTYIGDFAFKYCDNLTDITFPNSLQSVGSNIISNTAYYNDLHNWENDVLYIGNHLIDVKTTFKGICEIKEGTKCIADKAFYDCINLTDVTLPNGIIYIGEHAFFNCKSLTSITIPDSIKRIEDYAFRDCAKLTDIKLPNTYISIGTCAIWSNAYYSNPSNWDGDVLYLGNHLVAVDSGIKGSYTVKDGTIDISDEAFCWCGNLTSVTIPNSVTHIGDQAFSMCSSLTDLTMPESVEAIGVALVASKNPRLTLHVFEGSEAEKYAINAEYEFSYITAGLQNFKKNQAYKSNHFNDISVTDWYYINVTSAYEYSIMNGKTENAFEPSDKITIAESITVAARINNTYNYKNTASLTDVKSYWYTPYLIYAKNNGIISEEYPDYNSYATRAEFAQILAASVENADLQEINNIANGAIPDVDMSKNYAKSVYTLYRAGILTGSDKGEFKPDDTITRAEAAAIITRIINPELRKEITLY